jgi:hypothetical protein
VDVLSECSDCKRARDRADVAGKPGRAEGIAEKRKVAAGAALEWLSDLREASPCADCGASGKGARIRFFRRCDGAALNLMASNGLSVATVRAAAGASVPLCGACAGRAGAAMRFSGRHVAL